MLRSDTLFGKRDNNTPNSPLAANAGIVPTGTGINKTIAPITSPNASSGSESAPATAESGSKLIVGPNIKLKGGEITDCDMLVVEGRVEATINARVIQIAEHGAFKGPAEVDFAEIRGDFEGELTVRQKLVIKSTGKVSGKIRFGKLEVEEGGQLSGEIQVGTTSASKGLSVAKVG